MIFIISANTPHEYTLNENINISEINTTLYYTN